MIISILLSIFYICFIAFMFFMAVGFGGKIVGSIFMVFLFIVTFPRMKQISRALWKST